LLSDYNIEKLKMNGLYTCKPNVKYRGKLFENNLYHCCNWTFDVYMNHEGNYFMRDTYWSSGDSVYIPLTDENIDEFELVFERDKVKSVRKDEVNQYENPYRVAIDSGGWSYPKYFVSIDASKSKSLIIEEIDDKIRSLESELKYLLEKKEKLENGTYKLEWC
jgi:hypothetical protein